MVVQAEEGATLLSTLALLFFGALAAGCLPFFLRVRESHLQTVAALGAGLLVGSALAVIVPEGFHAFAQATAHAHAHVDAHAHDAHSHDHGDHDHSDHDHAHDAHSAAAGSAHGHAHEEGLPEGLAGLVLVGGFLAMLLLDHLQHAAGGTCSHPGHSHSHGHSHGHSHCGAEKEKELERVKGKAGGGKQATGAAEAGGGAPAAPGEKAGAAAGAAPPPKGAAPAVDPSAAITGLLIHCCADGLAMGAAFLSGNARLTMIIAAAMVLHKAPMAFGLSTYLLACGWGFQRSQRTLLAFAGAAPAATLATYGLLGSLTFLSSPPAVALCVIFSGGTFLYAATMHILPEVLSSGGGGGRMTGAQLAAVSAGALLPVALSWGHHH